MGVHSWASLLYFAYLLMEAAPAKAQAAPIALERRLAA
jgi:hypothetical protein